MAGAVEFIDLGYSRFPDFLEIQESVWKERVLGERPDTVIFSEHAPTISINERHQGRDLGHLTVSYEHLEQDDIPIVPVRRGGGIALHAPGILGCYVVQSASPDVCFSFFEHLAARVFISFGLKTDSIPSPGASAYSGKYVGAWVHEKKIAMIGINRFSGVTQFGINFNVSPDPKLLKLIHPCGIREYGMTSLAEEGVSVSVQQMKGMIQKILLQNMYI